MGGSFRIVRVAAQGRRAATKKKIKFGNLHASELIPPAPFSWEEKGESRRFLQVFSLLLFLREGGESKTLAGLFSPSLFKRRGRGMSSN
jgi:hypothetical protein